MTAHATTATEAQHYPVAIIGSGFSGLGMAIRLKQEGSRDFILFEREADVGGTWRVNHYPGCACDVQSHLYSFSFEPKPNWSRMYASQKEIRDYLEHCANKYGVRPHIRFNTSVSSARWDEALQRWQIRVADGREYTADVLISGMGGLSTPAYPNLPGQENFRGAAFHSQQWDHDYDLRGKRVAVIGTGASAIQFVPQLQKRVAHLDLYQRTPPWILPKPDRALSLLEQNLFKYAPAAQKLVRGAIYTMLESRAGVFVNHSRVMNLAKRWALNHIRRQISNPQLRKKVTPDYDIGCKRILLSNDYYPSLDQPNVDVVTQGIKEVRAYSIVTSDGVEREIDAIVYGTGFRATDPLPRDMVFGIGGKDINDAWVDGPEAYKGTTVSGFPNLFILMGPNTGLGHTSMVYMIESQINYCMDALRQMQQQGIASVDVKPQVQAAFNQNLQRRLEHSVWNQGGCKSWYLHPVSGRNVTLWPGYTWRFRQLTRSFDVGAYQLQRHRPLTPNEPSNVSVQRSEPQPI